MKEQQLREQLLDHALKLSSSGLSAGQSGNISVRYQDGLLITPSGMDYQQLSPDDMVWIDLQGNYKNEGLKPSSEWHFHCGIYQSRPDIHAILHAHPIYSTALACTGRPIPAFHYMVAIAGGIDIPIAPYALFGTEELSQNVTNVLQQRQACLLANHGMIALGRSLAKCYNLALEVENLAQQYCEVLKLGDANILDEQQMNDVLNAFKNYGQRV